MDHECHRQSTHAFLLHRVNKLMEHQLTVVPAIGSDENSMMVLNL
jgi:hypothetical protein